MVSIDLRSFSDHMVNMKTIDVSYPKGEKTTTKQLSGSLLLIPGVFLVEETKISRVVEILA